MKQYVLFFFLMLLPLCVAAQENITGYVIDDVTGDSLGFVTVQYKGQKLNTICDHRGYFSIPKHVGWKLTFSAVGYKTRTITVEKGTHRLLPSLKPDNKMLSEVTVKTKRSRYRRKNNPAVELMRKVIEHKKKTELSLRDHYQYTKYQKITLALNNIRSSKLLRNNIVLIVISLSSVLMIASFGTKLVQAVQSSLMAGGMTNSGAYIIVLAGVAVICALAGIIALFIKKPNTAKAAQQN